MCYGEVASDEQIEGFVKATGKSDSFVLMTVWYLPGTAGFELRDGYDLTIPAVPSAAYQPTSQGVEIKPDLDSVHAVDGKPHTFEGELTVTIGSSAPNTIHINLSDALTALMGRASHLDNNAIQPGDVMNYHVKLVNNSGKDFQYVADSAFAATIDRCVDGQQSLGTGFDGYQIAASLPDGSTEFCAIPRRVANDALKFLGVDKDLSDEAIGALLLAKGYGEGEDLTPAQVTQKYLAPFYLDFLNSQRAEDTQLAHSFLDLTGAEFARLTNYDNQNGDQPGVPETCETERVEKARVRLVQLQNKVKIRYVNNTNLLNYLYMKYSVENAAKLKKLWEEYQSEKEERKQFAEAEAKIDYYREKLLYSLSRYRVKSPERWFRQPQALLDHKEMVEIRHELNTRRQALREQMEYNRQLAAQAGDEIRAVAAEYPMYAQEISRMVDEAEQKFDS